jgi:2-haloacid dehalogenase
VAVCDWLRTLVDCHSAFVAALRAAGRKHSVEADWNFVELAWEMKIRVTYAAVEYEHIPWRPHETIAREALAATLADLGLGPSRFPGSTCDAIIAQFSRLPMWPDVERGIDALRDVLPVAVASSASSTTVQECLSLRGLRIDTIIGAELVRNFPPSLNFFREVARRLRKPPSRILYISADPAILAAAQSVGMSTALLQRKGTFAATAESSRPQFIEPDLLHLAASLTQLLPARPHRDAFIA